MKDFNDYPLPPEGVAWPNHLHVDAKYPDADTRCDIANEVSRGMSGKIRQTVVYALNTLRTVSDGYLFRQYYYRDMAKIALKAGNTEDALEWIDKIGKP